MIREEQIRMAREDAVRRLCRYVGIDSWATDAKLVLMDELIWKGIVVSSFRGGWY